jgi:hypothetical protein
MQLTAYFSTKSCVTEYTNNSVYTQQQFALTSQKITLLKQQHCHLYIPV